MSKPSAVTRISPRKELWASILTWVYVIATVWSIGLTIFRRGHGGSFPEYLFGMLLNIPVFPSLASVALLTLLTSALIRRKRVALLVVGILQLGGLILALEAIIADVLNFQLLIDLDGWGMTTLWSIMDLISVLIALSMVLLTWWLWPCFPARMSRGSVLLAVAVLATGFVVSVALTHLLVITTTHLHGMDWRILRYALLRPFGLVDPGVHQFGVIPRWIPGLTGFLIGATIFLAAYMFLRSSRRRGLWTGRQEVTLRSLLARSGEADSLGYFATRRDKDLIFSPDGQAAIAYRVVGSVCLASGDPVGPHSAWPGAIDAWLTRARTYGWMPAVLAAGERGARAYADAGLAVIALGDEAILDSNRFDLANTSMTPVRRAVAHARKAGLTTQIRRHQDLTDEDMRDVENLAETWREGGVERGFSMALNRLGDPADGQCVLVSAHDEQGRMVGFLSFVPWGRRGASLDLMRRAPEAPNGTNELLVAAMMQDGSSLGITRVSLNFAMFRSIFAEAQRIGANPVTRLNSHILGRLDRIFQLERLYRSNQKFQPEWIPRYLCAEGLLTLARVAWAAGVAEGFIPRILRPRDTEAGQLSPAELEEVKRIAAEKPDVADLAPRRSDQSRHRVRHLEMLREAGREPYPVGLGTPEPLADVAALLHADPDERGDAVRVQHADQTAHVTAGRVVRLRSHGGVTFIDLMDGRTRVQVVAEESVIGEAEHRMLRSCVDTGDLVVMTGVLGQSRNGTPSLMLSSWQMASKCLQPIPFDSFEDPESRLRRRSTDLVVHPQATHLLTARSRIVREIRSYLVSQGYDEVETPMLNTVHGGASARPFRTHINAYGMDLTLRIAPELYLKRLLVGGMGPIFEVGRNFRNEGADATHNPEFTALEAYKPFADYHVMRELTENLLKAAARAMYGKEMLPLRDVHRDDAPGDDSDGRRAEPVLTDVSGPWPVISVCDAVSAAVGREISLDTDFEELLALAHEHQIHVRDDMGAGALIEELYGELVEPATIFPTFYIDFPAETSPLTAPHRSTPGLVERWDLVANAMEIGTAYSELADPLEQRARLTEQSLKAAAGDPEAMEVDEDFLFALENAMPPAGGLGLGVDRIVMLLTDTNIREVLTFPFVKPARRGS
ncbi:bifunctional lysylphosphatidylglycerol synthetase/lysine--tRNA ligase LysX [Devriesea agamarum]|uniref:bifunctional lysylphosphatidylglycerol synthetase/lysine--tRNA ligase LysX n=1 Tax=Devriesea agamarum TaxID=472569 RepID=UPI0009FBA6E5|nr:bifunctional lysylphosphatidylglycerol synthetase/lysine--tRNA ligase LysX [Devriesea agamarum]